MNQYRNIWLIILILSLSVLEINGQQKRYTDLLPALFSDPADTIINPFELNKTSGTKDLQCRLDSIYWYDWSSGNEQWVNNRSYTYSYNDIGEVADYLMRNWVSNDSVWENSSMAFYFYNSNNLKEQKIVKSWNDSIWNNSTKNEYSYTTGGFLDRYIYYSWDDLLEQWEKSAKYIYDYDDQDNWTYYEKQTWDEDSLSWISSYRFVYTWENGLQTQYVRQSWGVTLEQWENNNQSVYEYTQEGKFKNETQYVWSGDEWENSTYIYFIFDENQYVIEKIYQSWDKDSADWQDGVRYTYENNQSGNPTEIIYQVWNSGWSDQFRYLYEYDDWGSLVEEKWQDWNSGQWKNDFRITNYLSYDYQLPLTVEITDSISVSCFGYSDGCATATPRGGTPPYTYLWDDEEKTIDSTVCGLSGDRYYHIIVTDSDLNTATDSVKLSQPDEIITGPVCGDTLVEINDTTSYWVENEPTSLYTWGVSNGILVEGQGSNEISVYWNDAGNGEVFVVETDSAGCTGDTVLLEVYISPTSIEVLPSVKLIIFPNPANEKLTIQLPEGFLYLWDLELLDITGKNIRRVEGINKTEYILSGEGISPGIYFIRIRYEKGQILRKVIIAAMNQ